MVNKLIELKAAAEKYSVALNAHRENPTDKGALYAWDAATTEFSRAIGHNEMEIIIDLLAHLESKDRRITWLESISTDYISKFQKAQDAAKHLIVMNDDNKGVIAELEAAAVVPGALSCIKCNFQLTKTILCMKTGTTGAGDSKTEPCPNGCGPLWPVTWKQWAKEMDEQAARYFEELKEVEAKLAKPAINDVIAERQRQVSEKGYTAESDDSYLPGILCLAGAAYAVAASAFPDARRRAKRLWPWPNAPKYFDPARKSAPRVNLVKAAALIIAEIERLDRAAGGKN